MVMGDGLWVIGDGLRVIENNNLGFNVNRQRKNFCHESSKEISISCFLYFACLIVQAGRTRCFRNLFLLFLKFIISVWPEMKYFVQYLPLEITG